MLAPDHLKCAMCAVHLAALFTPHLLKQPEACILNISSGLAFSPSTYAPTYGASKVSRCTYSILQALLSTIVKTNNLRMFLAMNAAPSVS